MFCQKLRCGCSLALKTTGRIQLLQVNSSPKTQQVPLRLPSEPLQVPALPLPLAQSAAAFLQVVIVPCLWAAPRAPRPVSSSRHGIWIQPGLQNQAFSSKGIKTKLPNTDNSLRTAGLTPVTLCLGLQLLTLHEVTASMLIKLERF